MSETGRTRRKADTGDRVSCPLTCDIGVVTVSYNTRALLEDCLESLRVAAAELVELDIRVGVCVVDNSSRDGSADMVANEFPQVDLVRSMTNEGFGRACNRGAARLDTAHLLFLNPDTRVTATTLERCLRFATAHTDVGILGCRVVLPDGTLDRACKRGMPTPLNAICYFMGLDRVFPSSRIVGGYNATYIDEFECADVEAVVGAYMWVRREVYEQLGGFDESYFMYGEDLDLCLRTAQLGFRVHYLGDCSVDHIKGASSGIARSSAEVIEADDWVRRRMTTEFHRAMLLFYDKHYDDRYPAIVGVLVRFAIRLRCRLGMIRMSGSGEP